MRAQGAEPTPRTRTGDIIRSAALVSYGALFVWQFTFGMSVGKETGFVLYFPLAVFPTFIAGSPWLWVLVGIPLLGIPNWFAAGRGFDLTVLSAHTLLYHAFVLASFAINVALIFKFLAWFERQAARSARQ